MNANTTMKVSAVVYLYHVVQVDSVSYGVATHAFVNRKRHRVVATSKRIRDQFLVLFIVLGPLLG